MLSYDNGDRRTSLALPGGITTTYAYDDANQLTQLTYSAGQTALGNLTYQYDATGRRVQIGGSFARTALPPALSSAAYDAANRVTQWDTEGLTYDAAGNLVSDGLMSYTWDARNRLSGLSGTNSAVFHYDVTGRRLDRTIGSDSRQFVLDGVDVVQELVSGTPLANRLTGLGVDETWLRTDAGGTRALLVDAEQSVVAETDASGTIQTAYTYEPFGAAFQTGQPGSTSQYTGRERDLQDGQLYFVRARYYSARLGRFISEDPKEFSGGLNLYAYANDDPTDYSDPFGEKPCSVRVRCAPVQWHGIGRVGFKHCYIVTKDCKDNYNTLEAGEYEENGRNTTVAFISPGDDPKRFKDQTVFFQESNETCRTVDCIIKMTKVWETLSIPYKKTAPGYNSNAFVLRVTSACGLRVTLPTGTFASPR